MCIRDRYGPRPQLLAIRDCWRARKAKHVKGASAPSLVCADALRGSHPEAPRPTPLTSLRGCFACVVKLELRLEVLSGN
eukprot:347964-Alexandrium_andersonii.AAC.1